MGVFGTTLAQTGLACALIMAGASGAFATAQLQLSASGGPTVTVLDTDNDGLATFIGSVGSVFTTNIVVGSTKPATNGTGALMDLHSLSIVSSGAGTLTVWWSDPGWTLPIPGATKLMSGSFAAPAGSTVTMSAFRDTSNAVLPPTLGTTSEIATTQIFTPGAVSATVSGSFSPTTDPYSLTQQIVINTTGAGLFSLDFLLSPVPEPASVLFLGTVLLICFKALRRRTNVA